MRTGDGLSEGGMQCKGHVGATRSTASSFDGWPAQRHIPAVAKQAYLLATMLAAKLLWVPVHWCSTSQHQVNIHGGCIVTQLHKADCDMSCSRSHYIHCVHAVQVQRRGWDRSKHATRWAACFLKSNTALVLGHVGIDLGLHCIAQLACCRNLSTCPRMQQAAGSSKAHNMQVPPHPH